MNNAEKMRSVMESGGVPKRIGDFLELNETNEEFLLYIPNIASIHKRPEGGTYIYMLGEEDAWCVQHSYEDVKKALSKEDDA